jgi:hypothetical protein
MVLAIAELKNPPYAMTGHQQVWLDGAKPECQLRFVPAAWNLLLAQEIPPFPP